MAILSECASIGYPGKQLNQPSETKSVLGHSSEAVRAFNRRLILNLIRTRQPLSRADLSRLSGLQRSTISLIVEELILERWVLEGPLAKLPRGRHPTSLRLNEDRVIIGADIRPAQITMGVGDVNGRFLTIESIPTPKDPQAAIQQLVDWIRYQTAAFAKEKMVEGIGIALPGRAGSENRELMFAPNMHWPAVDLRTPIAEATGYDVVLENAANACVLSSVWFSSNTPSRNLVAITVSEGIGSGLYVNGQLARGVNGMAGEFGHVPVGPDGPLCSCGRRGCWELYGSNRAALRYYEELTKSPQPEVTFSGLLAKADEGDAKAIQAISEMAKWLAFGMRIIVGGLAPERINVIGELTRSWSRFGPVIDAAVLEQTSSGGVPPLVIPIHEDGLARLRGTIALVLQKDFAEPTA